VTQHRTGTYEQWLAARLELLAAEKELTRRGDEVAKQRQELPWVQIDKEYRFETDQGTRTLAELFDGCSQLVIYHFMFGPEYSAGCPSCSAIADGFDGSVVHLMEPARPRRTRRGSPTRSHRNRTTMNDTSANTTLVVGASRGLGRGIAAAFAQAGTPVVAVWTSPSPQYCHASPR
jgi:hypothetical protein